ncbi:hypothetical protein [Vibrio sp. S11_S32]|uniref:hypothetical protein n=1 Tax=Vibrio sp. S11_S32 TaxID=2720225 RepID=UPI001680EE02|nr:hypothetical protein [Vibrio sp. S11_S32]
MVNYQVSGWIESLEDRIEGRQIIGYMGHLWQTLVLSEWQSLLAYLPVETVIKSRQDQYYQAFRQADEQTDCSNFIEFLLQALTTSLHEAININSSKTRVKTPERIIRLLMDNS